MNSKTLFKTFLQLSTLIGSWATSSYAAEDQSPSLTLRQDNRYTVGMKLGSSGENGAAIGYYRNPNSVLEFSYLRKESESKDVAYSGQEILSFAYRHFWGNSFNVNLALGFSEYNAEIDEQMQIKVDVMRRDLVLRAGVGNRWEIDDLLWFGVEWCAGQTSLTRLDQWTSVRSLSEGQGSRFQAERRAMQSVQRGQGASASLLSLELGMNF